MDVSAETSRPCERRESVSYAVGGSLQVGGHDLPKLGQRTGVRQVRSKVSFELPAERLLRSAAPRHDDGALSQVLQQTPVSFDDRHVAVRRPA